MRRGSVTEAVELKTEQRFRRFCLAVSILLDHECLRDGKNLGAQRGKSAQSTVVRSGEETDRIDGWERPSSVTSGGPPHC